MVAYFQMNLFTSNDIEELKKEKTQEEDKKKGKQVRFLFHKLSELEKNIKEKTPAA